jgi:hypothetical protein
MDAVDWFKRVICLGGSRDEPPLSLQTDAGEEMSRVADGKSGLRKVLR